MSKMRKEQRNFLLEQNSDLGDLRMTNELYSHLLGAIPNMANSWVKRGGEREGERRERGGEEGGEG